MPRTLTAAVRDAASAPVCRTVHLLDLTFIDNPIGGTIFLTDAPVQIRAPDGRTYQPAYLLGFSDYEEQRELFVPRVTVTLSGVDQAIIAVVLSIEIWNRPARLRKAFLDEGNNVLVDPNVLIDGIIDKPLIVADPDSGTCAVSVDIVSRLAAQTHHSGRHTNDTEQQAFFPGDKGFEFAGVFPQAFNWGAVGHYPFISWRTFGVG
jgi:hypothetical protein